MIKLPPVLVAELTSTCNHQCIFCSCPWANETSYALKEMSTAEWRAILYKLLNFGVKQVTFTGGECTMRQDLFELIDYAYHLGYAVGVISNGKLIDEPFLRRLAKYPVLLSISVPGIKTFADTTKTDGFEHTLSLFDQCKKYGIKTVANITVTKKNLGELYANIALPILHGATHVLLNRFLPGGRGLQNQEFLLSIDEINQMLDTAERVLSKSGIRGHVGTELPYCIIKNPRKYQYLRVGSLCAGGKNFFVIDPSGNIKVCNHSPQTCCHWTEIENLTSNAYWQDFAQAKYIPAMCSGCQHLGSKCDGGCREAAHVANGAINQPDPCFKEVKAM